MTSLLLVLSKDPYTTETPDLVVAGMNLHEQRRAWPDRFRVVGEMRAIGRSDFLQPSSGSRDDVRHAEMPADLDQFTARHDCTAARR